MTVVDAWASEVHYAEHLAPIFDALPENVRGSFRAHRATWRGLASPAPLRRHTDERSVLLVASWRDLREQRRGRPVVFVEHGAGQSYDGDERSSSNRAYSGGAAREGVSLYVVPNEHVAARCIAVQPDVPVAVVGCPKLDRWHDPLARPCGPDQARDRPVVAFTWHHDHPLVPETRSALDHYRPGMRRIVDHLRAEGVEVLGHAHPRARRTAFNLYAEIGVHVSSSFAQVLDRAHVLVADNTSALYEFASTARPVVVLNAPWYRRDVEHGLRFWSHVPGPQVDDPADVATCVLSTLRHPAGAEALRRRAVEHVYPQRDGHAAERAAAAIVELLEA